MDRLPNWGGCVKHEAEAPSGLFGAAPMTEVRHIRQCERLLKAISIATKTIDT